MIKKPLNDAVTLRLPRAVVDEAVSSPGEDLKRAMFDALEEMYELTSATPMGTLIPDEADLQLVITAGYVCGWIEGGKKRCTAEEMQRALLVVNALIEAYRDGL